MSRNDKVFTGSIPEIYDRFMVPMLFAPYADDLARRVSQKNPKRVLETAAGSGVVSRVLAPQLADDAHYCVTDLNQPMLDRAKDQQQHDSRLAWEQADAMALPFDDASFDVVCCQFGVMFLPNKVAGFREAKRVLKPGGAFIFNVWDRIEKNTFAQIATETAATFFPDDPPRFLERTPHGYHNTTTVKNDLIAAGFAEVEVETIEKASVVAAARDAAFALCQGTPLRNEILDRDNSVLDEVTDKVTEVIEERFGTSVVNGLMKAHVFTALKE